MVNNKTVAVKVRPLDVLGMLEKSVNYGISIIAPADINIAHQELKRFMQGVKAAMEEMVKGDKNEAYHILYSLLDPNFEKYAVFEGIPDVEDPKEGRKK